MCLFRIWLWMYLKEQVKEEIEFYNTPFMKLENELNLKIFEKFKKKSNSIKYEK